MPERSLAAYEMGSRSCTPKISQVLSLDLDSKKGSLDPGCLVLQGVSANVDQRAKHLTSYRFSEVLGLSLLTEG